MLNQPAGDTLRSYLPKNFDNVFLLERALTHRSYLNERRDALEDNERLEFLGDSILGFIVAEWVYHNFPEKKEGFLTKIRSALVHTGKLSELARSIELGPALLLGKGEVAAGGNDRDAILCDAFEALIAAMFLSTDLKTVRDFITPMLEKETEKILKERSEEDSKSLLQEWAQSQGFSSPNYQTIAQRGPDHSKTFLVEVMINNKVIGQGIGSSKQNAEKSAASAALKCLNL
ncbi:MAG: ribonuclease III [Anaerolineaceae bacterium]